MFVIHIHSNFLTIIQNKNKNLSVSSLKMIFIWFVFCHLGVPGLITADMVKEGAAVIDVGINRIQDPKTGKVRLIGDVDFEGKIN